MDIHAGRMDLIVEGEATLWRHTSLIQPNNSHTLPEQNHLAILVIKEDDAIEILGKAIHDQVLGNVVVAHTSDEGSCIDENMERRVGADHVIKKRLDGPIGTNKAARDNSLRCQVVVNLTINTLVELTLAQLLGQ